MVTATKKYLDQEVVQDSLSRKKFMPLLPLLESPLSDIKMIYNIDEKNLIDLVCYALDWELKEYWQSLSVEWIEGGIPINEETKTKLKKIPDDKGYSQKFRHRVSKLMNKLKR